MLLGLDTATAAVTAAVCALDGTVLARASVTDPRRHGEVLAVLLDRVRRDAAISYDDLTEVMVGVGPGPFTGLRVGVVTAQAFGYARGLPVTGVCSLDALAHTVARGAPGAGAPLAGAPAGTEFLVATDARRREVYWARYEIAESAIRRARRLTGPAVSAPGELQQFDSLACVGQGPVLYPDALTDGGEPRQADAADLIGALLAARSAGAAAEVELPITPLYLRRPDAVVPGPPKQVHHPVAEPR